MRQRTAVEDLRALVIDRGSSRESLAAVRGLGQDGWSVGVGSPRGQGVAARSRFTRWREDVPSPLVDHEAFVEAVNAAIDEHGYPLVFGAGDAEVLALSLARERLRAEVPYPDHAQLLRGMDKHELTQAARSAGVRTPETVDATEESIAATSRWPLIMKARLHSIAGRDGAPARIQTSLVRTPAEALQRIAEVHAAGGEPMLQELVEGQLIALIMVLDSEHGVIARVQQRAERTFPAAAGVSARAVTVKVDHSLAELAANMLVELGWTGLAQLQFMQSPAGEPYLIDLNARFYGSIPLAIASGVNLPALWARLAIGQSVAAVPDANPGVRFQWLEGDLRAVMSGHYGGRAAALVDWLRWLPVSAHGTWRFDDPLPVLTNAVNRLRRGASKLLRGRFTA